MKKSLLIAIAAICTALDAAALSPIRLGIDGGVNFMNISLPDPAGKNYTYSANGNNGYYLGASLRVSLPLGLYLNPGMLYSHNSYDLTYTPPIGSSTGYGASEVKLNTLQIPVVAGLKVAIFCFEAGPVFNVWNKGEGPKVSVSRPSVGYTAGAGIKLWKLSVMARYNGDFGRTMQSIQVEPGATGEDIDARIGVWMLGAGIRF